MKGNGALAASFLLAFFLLHQPSLRTCCLLRQEPEDKYNIRQPPYTAVEASKLELWKGAIFEGLPSFAWGYLQRLSDLRSCGFGLLPRFALERLSI